MIGELKNFHLKMGEIFPGFEKDLSRLIAGKLHVAPDKLNVFRVIQKSLDCRHRDPELIYNLFLECERETAETLNLREVPSTELDGILYPGLDIPQSKRLKNPIVVGTGPAGIFCALALSLAGTNPIILDWGSPIRERYLKYRNFVEHRFLSESDNLLIGEGGAGAFSDGKLYTGTKSPFSAFILKCAVDAGAPVEILYAKRPHIGSDYLRKLAEGLRQKIQTLGGTFQFHSKVVDFLIQNHRCTGVLLESGEVISAEAVFVAPGLGGRELVSKLRLRGVDYQLKPFQIGCRMEHPQSFIDQIMYHSENCAGILGAAEYHLVARNPDPALDVSSFCMCPGGEVLNATAWNEQSISNGMSNFSRSGKFGNSCLIMTLPVNYFSNYEECMKNIIRMEKECFALGGGDYTLPAQDAEAFLRGEKRLKNKKSSVAVGTVPARIDKLVLPRQKEALDSALRYFNRHYPGFVEKGKMIGIESCVSSPIRFLRDHETLETSIKGLYVGGEGAGCAGGIMSAAADGIRNAIAMVRNSKIKI